jgi:hypothetical protein
MSLSQLTAPGASDPQRSAVVGILPCGWEVRQELVYWRPDTYLAGIRWIQHYTAFPRGPDQANGRRGRRRCSCGRRDHHHHWQERCPCGKHRDGSSYGISVFFLSDGVRVDKIWKKSDDDKKKDIVITSVFTGSLDYVKQKAGVLLVLPGGRVKDFFLAGVLVSESEFMFWIAKLRSLLETCVYIPGLIGIIQEYLVYTL